MPSAILKHSQLTEQILNALYAVYKELGFGFLEKVYENAMAIELRNLGLQVKHQVPIEVAYKEQVVGRYDADLIVNDLVILELKSAQALTDAHQAQMLNYLKATRIEVGLLLNFGPKAEFKRKAFDNSRKGTLSWIKY